MVIALAVFVNPANTHTIICINHHNKTTKIIQLLTTSTNKLENVISLARIYSKDWVMGFSNDSHAYQKLNDKLQTGSNYYTTTRTTV